MATNDSDGANSAEPAFSDLTSMLTRMKALVTQDTSAVEQLFAEHFSTLQDLPGFADLPDQFRTASAPGAPSASGSSAMLEPAKGELPRRLNASLGTRTDWAYARRALLRYTKRV